MKNMLRVRYLLLTSFFSLLALLQAHGQMKIGNHPTEIHPASILELESNNQGLRLTQVTDTLAVNNTIGTEAGALTAAEGLIVYSKKDSSIYIRLHGYWHRVLASNGTQLGFWSTTGNITSADSNYIGTTNPVALHIGADSSARIIITPSGLVKIVDSLQALHAQIDTVTVNDSLNVANIILVNKDSTHINKSLYIQDSAIIRTLRSVTGDTAVLTINPAGVVHKMSIDSLLSKGVRSINGVGGTNIHLKFGSEVAGHNGPWIDSVSARADSALILNIPAATGINGQAVNGIVDSTTQSFGGAKSFRDSIAVGQLIKPNSTLQVNGTVSMATVVVNSGSGYDLTTDADSIRTLIIDAQGISIPYTVTLPVADAHSGRIYTIKKIGDIEDAQLDKPVTIKTSGSDKIEGESDTFIIYNNFTSVTLQAQGSNWYIVR